MQTIRVAKLLELHLGRADGDNAPAVIEYLSLGAHDVLHQGNNYRSDGRLVDIGPITETIWLEKTSTNIVLTNLNQTLTRRINTKRYRNLVSIITMAQVASDGSLSNHLIFRLYGNSHEIRGTIITLKLESIWARFEQTAPSRNSTSAQAALIAAGLFEGVPVDARDRAFDGAAQDHSNLVLGETVAGVEIQRGARRFVFFGSRTKIRIPIPGQPGATLADDGDDYNRNIIYGGATVPGDLIAAWNPTEQAVLAAYPGTWKNPPERTAPATRFVTLVYAVCEGRLESLTINFRGLAADLIVSGGWSRRVNGLAAGAGGALDNADYSFTIGNAGTFDLEQGAHIAGTPAQYRTVSDGAGRGNNTFTRVLARDAVPGRTKFERVAAFDVVLGTDNQSSMARVITLARNNVWSADHHGYGTALVAVTLAAGDLWGSSFPSIDFTTAGRHVSVFTAEFGESPNSAEQVTHNPAWVIYDLLTNRRFGRGLDAAEINLDSFINGAGDYAHAFTSGDFDTTCRGVLTGDISYHDALRAVLDATNSHLVTGRDGRIHLLVKHYPSPAALARARSLIFDRTNRGPITKLRYAQTSEVYNQARVQVPIVNRQPGETYEITVRDPVALAADQDQKSEINIEAPMAGAELDAAGEPTHETLESLTELARSAIDRSRLYTTAEFETFMWEFRDEITVGSLVTLADPVMLPGLQPLGRVTELSFEEFGRLKVKWVEFHPDIYDTTRSVQRYLSIIPGPGSVVRRPVVEQVFGLEARQNTTVLNDGTAHYTLQVSWLPTAGSTTEVRINGIQGTILHSQYLPGTSEIESPGLAAGETYTITVRHLLGGYSEPIVLVRTIAASDGAVRRPGDVTGLRVEQAGQVITFRWEEVADYDLAGYVIRFGGRDTDFSDSTTLTRSTRGTTISSAVLLAGPYTFWITAINTSGLESALPGASDFYVFDSRQEIIQVLSAPNFRSGRLEPFSFDVAGFGFVRHHTGVLIPQSRMPASDDAAFDSVIPLPFNKDLDAAFAIPSYDNVFFDLGRVANIAFSVQAIQRDLGGVVDAELPARSVFTSVVVSDTPRIEGGNSAAFGVVTRCRYLRPRVAFVAGALPGTTAQDYYTTLSGQNGFEPSEFRPRVLVDLILTLSIMPEE